MTLQARFFQRSCKLCRSLNSGGLKASSFSLISSSLMSFSSMSSTESTSLYSSFILLFGTLPSMFCRLLKPRSSLSTSLSKSLYGNTEIYKKALKRIIKLTALKVWELIENSSPPPIIEPLSLWQAAICIWWFILSLRRSAFRTLGSQSSCWSPGCSERASSSSPPSAKALDFLK